jgi:pyridoxamine 5'-phosphate oxidase
MVLLKDVDERGFVFATSYTSRKGRELAENERAALLFYWHPLGRRCASRAGRARRADESDAIFLARPRDSRISALASRQSEPLASREQLEARVAALEAELEGARSSGRDSGAATSRARRARVLAAPREPSAHPLRLRRRGDGWEIESCSPEV